MDDLEQRIAARAQPEPSSHLDERVGDVIAGYQRGNGARFRLQPVAFLIVAVVSGWVGYGVRGMVGGGQDARSDGLAVVNHVPPAAGEQRMTVDPLTATPTPRARLFGNDQMNWRVVSDDGVSSALNDSFSTANQLALTDF